MAKQSWLDGLFENRGWTGLVQQDQTTGSLRVGGENINALPPVYDWGVDCPLPSDLAPNTVIGISPDSFGGSGKSTFPIYLRSDGDKFMPAGKQLLCRQNGSKASPVSGVAANIVSGTTCRFSQGTSYSVPADFLAIGWNVSLQATGFRGTTVGGTARLRPMISTSDAMSDGSSIPLAQSTIAATASAAWNINIVCPIGPSGVLVRNDSTALIGLLNGSSGDGSLTIGSRNYFLVGVDTATAGDDFALVNYSFYIE